MLRLCCCCLFCPACYDGCTGVLLNDLKNMSFSLQLNITGVAYPWEDVYRLHNETVELKVIAVVYFHQQNHKL